MTDEQRLEKYISNWNVDEPYLQFAKDLGCYMLQFMGRLSEQGIAEKTVKKHVNNCWAIGFLECSYGYRKVFKANEMFSSAQADHTSEFKRKFSDSAYAESSFKSTWRKLHKYSADLD
jgi:hypothetical protein